MSQEQRDEWFEKALRRQLRTGELGAEVGAEGGREACPDVETLAAYHESSLDSAEMSRCKEHIVSCHRCQEILARVEESEQIPLAMVEGEFSQTVSVSSGLRVAAETEAQSARAVVQIKPGPRRIMKWIAPVGALAACLLVWIAVRENRKASLDFLPQPKAVAQREAAIPEVGSKMDSQIAKQQKEKHDDRLTAETASKTPRSPQEVPPNMQAENKTASLAPYAKKVPPVAGAGGTRTTGASSNAFPQDTPEQNAIAQNGEQQNGGAVGGVAGKSDQSMRSAKPALKSVAGLAAAPPPPAASVSRSGEQTVLDREDLQEESVEKEKREVARQRGAAERDAAARSLQDSVSLSMTSVALPPAADVIAPDGQAIWRITGNGQVRHSTDGGKTWKVQNTGVSATLLAGSAPSDRVCWLAGNFGIVLLSSDSGGHWTKLAAPVSVPISEIHAKDAEKAVITLQGSRVQFATYDGGQTWTMLTGKADQPQ